MAEAKTPESTTKLNLSRAYTYNGKTYGPGAADVPSGAVDRVTAKEAKAQDRLQTHEAPPPVTPSIHTSGEVHDPRRRPAQQVAVTDEGPRRNLAQDSQFQRDPNAEPAKKGKQAS